MFSISWLFYKSCDSGSFFPQPSSQVLGGLYGVAPGTLKHMYATTSPYNNIYISFNSLLSKLKLNKQ